VPAEGDSKQQAAAMMQQVARLFEAGIRAHPQDWHMLQRVFAADLDPARLAAGSAAGTGRSEGGS
jgi:lauroyl/myristoyl acyltransferase